MSLVTAAELRAAGLAWPQEGALAERAVRVDDAIDLDATAAALESARAFYRQQLDEARAFKSQWGARDYADFTDAHENNVHHERLFSEPLELLARIRAALPKRL